MPQLVAAANGSIRTAYLQPQPDDTVPRFDYETHLAALTGPAPHWPDGTRSISELRLSLRVQPSGLLSGLTGPKTIHLDIVDYPGEWLLDLGLLEKSYADWSAETLRRAETRAQAADFRRWHCRRRRATNPSTSPTAKALTAAYTGLSELGAAGGLLGLTPGRFLLPGDLAGSPVLTFAPLPQPAKTQRGSLWREFERRFEAYKRAVVKPFFRDHFARIDRQVVLVDVLGAIHAGPPAVEDLRMAMADILGGLPAGAQRVPVAASSRQAGGAHPLRRDQGRSPAPHPARRG